MNKQEASARGYVFSGYYSHDKNEMKLKSAEARKDGNKAVVVNEPTSKYSRGCRGMGFSVYILKSEKNIQKETHQAAVDKLAITQRKVTDAMRILADCQTLADQARKEMDALITPEVQEHIA